jgi:hypothetical protein
MELLYLYLFLILSAKKQDVTATLRINFTCTKKTQKSHFDKTPQITPVLTSLHISITYHAQYCFQPSSVLKFTLSKFCSMIATTLICGGNRGYESYGNPRHYVTLVEERHITR